VLTGVSRFDEIISQEADAILPPSDPRVARVARVSTALITALEEEQKTLIYGATWPPATAVRRSELSRVIHERQRGGGYVAPSATAMNSFVTYRPDDGDPLINLDREDWNIYVVEGVRETFPTNWTQVLIVSSHSRKSTPSRSHPKRSLCILDWWTSSMMIPCFRACWRMRLRM
jgi:hypothetical protein